MKCPTCGVELLPGVERCPTCTVSEVAKPDPKSDSPVRNPPPPPAPSDPATWAPDEHGSVMDLPVLTPPPRPSKPSDAPTPASDTPPAKLAVPPAPPAPPVSPSDLPAIPLTGTLPFSAPPVDSSSVLEKLLDLIAKQSHFEERYSLTSILASGGDGPGLSGIRQDPSTGSCDQDPSRPVQRRRTPGDERSVFEGSTSWCSSAPSQYPQCSRPRSERNWATLLHDAAG